VCTIFVFITSWSSEDKNSMPKQIMTGSSNFISQFAENLSSSRKVFFSLVACRIFIRDEPGYNLDGVYVFLTQILCLSPLSLNIVAATATPSMPNSLPPQHISQLITFYSKMQNF
jgi:hypothetical protein